MKVTKEHPVAVQLSKFFDELVAPALREGQLDFQRTEFAGSMFLSNQLHGVVGEYDLTVEFLAGPGEPEDDPAFGVLRVELRLADRGPTLTFDRHTNRDTWYVNSRGTLSLPDGHPLGDLAHHASHLCLDATRMETQIDDKTAFQQLKKVGHIVQHQSL